MTADDLIAIEEIKKLKAKYLRFMDQRRWDEWIDLFADDATIRVTQSDQEYCFWRGKAEIREGNSSRNTGNTSIHHGSAPDIDITGPTTAKGAWMLSDTYVNPEGRTQLFGYYEDEYVKIDGRWKVQAVNCHLYPA